MTSLIKHEAARANGRWRKYRRVRRFHAWAVRGGLTVDVDGSTYHTSYLGWRCFDHLAKVTPELSGCNVALFATRAQGARGDEGRAEEGSPESHARQGLGLLAWRFRRKDHPYDEAGTMTSILKYEAGA